MNLKQRGVFVNSPQGGKKIGELINGVLHMNRDYKKHHYNKNPGWAIDAATLDANIDRIHAFVIHSTGRPTVNGEVDESLCMTFEDLIKTRLGEDTPPSTDNIRLLLQSTRQLDYGHGSQYLFEDKYWDLQVSTAIKPSFNIFELDVSIDELMAAPLSIPFQEPENIEVPLSFSPDIFEGQSTRFFTGDIVETLVRAKYKVYYPSIGQDFYFVIDNNVLTLKKEGTSFSVAYSFNPSELKQPLFTLDLI